MHTELTEHCQLLSIGTLQAVDVNCGFMKSVVELKVCTQHCFMLFIKSDTCNIIFGRSVALLKNSGWQSVVNCLTTWFFLWSYKSTANFIKVAVLWCAKQKKIGNSCIIYTNGISQKSKDIHDFTVLQRNKAFLFYLRITLNCILIHVFAFVKLRLIQIKSELALMFLPAEPDVNSQSSATMQQRASLQGQLYCHSGQISRRYKGVGHAVPD